MFATKARAVDSSVTCVEIVDGSELSLEPVARLEEDDGLLASSGPWSREWRATAVVSCSIDTILEEAGAMMFGGCEPGVSLVALRLSGGLRDVRCGSLMCAEQMLNLQ